MCRGVVYSFVKKKDILHNSTKILSFVLNFLMLTFSICDRGLIKNVTSSGLGRLLSVTSVST